MLGVAYAVFMLVIYVAKWNAHKPSRTQWPLVDYCYTVNFATAAWVASIDLGLDFPLFMKLTTLVSATGPVIIASQLYNISISTDPAHLANWFFHVPPAMICWWLSSGVMQSTGLGDLFFAGIAWYCLWQMCYVILMFVLLGKFFEENPTEMYTQRWFVYDQDTDPIAVAVIGFCRQKGIMGPEEPLEDLSWKTRFTFMTVQFLYTLITLSISLGVLFSPIMHGFFVWGLFIVTVSTGVDKAPYSYDSPEPYQKKKASKKKA